MKRTIVTVVIVLESFFMAALPVIRKSSVIVGKDLVTEKEIKATKYEFDSRIFNSTLDTTYKTLTLQFRCLSSNEKFYENEGELAVFDLITKEIRWSKEINYRNTRIEQYDGVLFLSRGMETTRVDLSSGNSLWNSKVAIFATIPNLNISLGYRYSGFSQSLVNYLSCIELSTGTILWKRPVDRNYGWNSIKNLNDTSIIIKSFGLHQINLKTGKGWDYVARTGLQNYSKTFGANVGGVALGIFTGTFVISGGRDLVSNLVSNIAEDSLNFYFASKEYLACLSHDGKINWKAKLPKETSHSNIMVDSTTVYLVNDGEADYNGKKYNYGKPYIAAFDKLTGHQHYQSIFDLDENPLLEFVRGKDSVDLFFKDRSIRYALKNGAAKTINYDKNQVGEFKYTVASFSNYIKTDSTFQSLHSLDPRAMYLMSTNKNVIKLNDNLSFDRLIGIDDLYSLRAETQKYKFLYHNKKLIVVNQLNKSIAELELGKKNVIFENKLYAIDDNSITEIELSKECF